MNKERKKTLSELIEESVICFLETDSRSAALEELVNALAVSGKIMDRESFFEAISKREKIVSTAIGLGVAIPHARLSAFDHFSIAVGLQKEKEGIPWNARDGAPVRLIFMIGGPVDQQTDYLKILSSLTAAVKDEDRRKKLLNTKTREDVVSLFEGC
ncbi:MAG: PTS sugar transporter subunit IIA [Simkaniaceae bacterium]|nr:PTS sugar transporter subunit IIA [Simkaniaceae bacterium]